MGKKIMTEKTLYLIQSNFANTQTALDKLTQVYTTEDAVVLIGESALMHESTQLQDITHLYMLENDAEILAKQPNQKIHLINYANFSELVLSFTRCISLK